MSEDTIRFVDETKQTQDTYSYLKPIGIRKLRKQINTKEFKKNYFVIDTRKDEPMVVHYDSGTQGGIAPNMQLTSANASSGTPSSGMITSPLKTPTRTPTFEFQNMCLNQPTNHGNTPQQLSQHAFFNPSSSSVSNPLIMNHPHSSPPTHELSMNYFGMDPMCMNVSTHTPASTPTSANGHHVQFMQAPFLPQQTQSTLTSSNGMTNTLSSSSMKRKHTSSSSSNSSTSNMNSRRTLSMPDCLVNFSPNDTAMNFVDYELQSSLYQQQLQANKKCKLGNEGISPTHHHILNGEQQIMFSNQAWMDGTANLNQQQAMIPSSQTFFDFNAQQDGLFGFGDNGHNETSYQQTNSMTKHISLNHYPQLHHTQIQLLETLQMILNQNHPQQLEEDGNDGMVVTAPQIQSNSSPNEQGLENSPQFHQNMMMDQQQEVAPSQHSTSFGVASSEQQQPSTEYQDHQQLWNDIDENGIFSPVDHSEFLLQDLSGDNTTTTLNNLNTSSSSDNNIIENSSPQPSNE